MEEVMSGENKEFTKMNARDKIDQSLMKLAFMSDAIMYWDIKTIGIEENTQYGYGLIMEDIIEDIKLSMEIIDK
jgi:hypothetical protein